MIVALGVELLRDPPVDPPKLAMLAAALHPHVLVYDDQDGLMEESLLYEQIRRHQSWLCHQLLEATPIPASPARPIAILGGALPGADSIPASTVAVWLSQRLAVMVEDIENDRKFVCEIIRRLWRKNSLASEPNELIERVEFVHCGGGRMAEVIQTSVQQGRRVIAIADSDRDYQDQPLDPEKTAGRAWPLVQQLQQQTIRLIVLERKEAENYISDEEIVAWRVGKDGLLLQVWREGGRWKWWFDMKKGIKKGKITFMPSAIQDRIGDKNFGKHVIGALRETSGPHEAKFLDHHEVQDLEQFFDTLLELI